MSEATSTSYGKLIKTLQTIFEMDKADLDFGIYRIMNQKRDEINSFLENDLLPQVKEAFADFATGSQSELKKELQAAIEQAREFGAPDPENAPAVVKIREKMATSVDITAVENEVYSHLHTFFSRYYDKGDFISQRRYKSDTYAIPYEGEEVKLYWANHDQYYIKSSEHLRDYAFTVDQGGDKSVRIRLVEADTEKDNVKAKSGEERRFVLDKENPLSVENDELTVRFQYIPVGKKKQVLLNQEAVKTIFRQQGYDEWLELLKQKAPSEKNPDRTVLEKHLNDYTARNTFDYFIHKDLGGFLRRELDFYIKNEVLHLDDIDDAAFNVTEQHLRKIRVIRTIALKLIRMLAQLEDFQKKLWLKKKFVIETNYCFSLDKIPFDEDLFISIFSNEAQLNSWADVHGIDLEKLNEDYDALDWEEFLNSPNYKYLVVDTYYHESNIIDQLLKNIEDIDEIITGELINADNYHALSLATEKYNRKSKFCYIDPPYNTGDDDFLYKDKYLSSSWLSFLRDRLLLAQRLLCSDYKFACSIDDNESGNLRQLLDMVFEEELIADIAYERSGSSGLGQGGRIVNTKEHIFSYAKNKNTLNDVSYTRQIDFETQKRYNKILSNEGNREEVDRFVAPSTGEDVRIYKHTGYEIGTISLRDYKNRKAEIQEEYISSFDRVFRLTSVQKENEFQNKILKKCKDGMYSADYLVSRGRHAGKYITIYYYNSQIFVWLKDSASLDKGVIVKSNKITDHWSHGEIPKADLANEGGVTLSRGKKPEQLMSRLIEWCSNTSDLVLDFFSGSGTTAATAIKMKRRALAIDNEAYFREKGLKRLKAVLGGEQSGVSKKSNWEGGGAVRYCMLESYEDALNNLVFKGRTSQQNDMLKGDVGLREDYMLGYWLDVETADSPSLLNIDQFEDPFNYKLNISSGSVGATKPTRVDLVETFNYLLGLTVKHIDTIRGFRLVTGANPKDESVLVVWRKLKEKDNAALEAFLDKSGYNPKDTEYDHIYVNGDHTLEDPHSKVKMTEIEFKRLMFDVQDV